ncbi:MAG: hypothetical protein ACOCP4_05500 [Candidatus Woesearchaeota archaeon]
MTKEKKYKKVPLTEEEYEKAKINAAQLKSQIETAELNLKHLDIDEKNKYSERLSVLNAREQLQKMREQIQQNLETSKLNLKVYENQVKTKMREEPVDEELDEKEE